VTQAFVYAYDGVS